MSFFGFESQLCELRFARQESSNTVLSSHLVLLRNEIKSLPVVVLEPDDPLIHAVDRSIRVSAAI